MRDSVGTTDFGPREELETRLTRWRADRSRKERPAITARGEACRRPTMRATARPTPTRTGRSRRAAPRAVCPRPVRVPDHARAVADDSRVRADEQARRRGHGRGLSGAANRVESPGRREDDSRRQPGQARAFLTVPDRGRGGRAASPPQHCADSRHWRGRRTALLLVGAIGRRVA